MFDDPASNEFSINSFTTDDTDVITWELESRRTVDEGKQIKLIL